MGREAMNDNENEIEFISLADLLLDPENPRLPESVDRDQQSMLDYIAETTAIEELMDAIAENDFFPGEPLIVTPYQATPGKFVVIEGNRRLTATKILQDPASCSRPGSRMREISQNATYTPNRLPVVIRATRAEVLPYLGFRHITGIKQWEPLSKARYIEQLFNITKTTDTPKDRYGHVARAIGSRRDHIKRNLDALAVFKIIKDEDFFEIEDLNDESLKFAVLSTALADERIGAFAGSVSKTVDDDYEPTHPIVDLSKLNKEHIRELTKWLFEKDAKGKSKVGESRNLRLLSAVVGNTRSLAALRGGSPLKIAYQLTSDLTKDFGELLYQSEAALMEASSMVATVEYDEDAYQVARRILENIKLIGRELKEKRRPEDDEF